MVQITLNDILNIENIGNVKIRFNLMFLENKGENWSPIEIFKNGDLTTLLNGQYHNNNKKSYKNGQITIGLIKITRDEDLWLLFHVGKIINDLNIFNGVGYDYESLSKYDKFLGRLIVKFKNKSQTMIRNAESVMDECLIHQILPDSFDNEIFPGYDKINLTWEELRRVIEKDNWKTALQNQKGIYLISDVTNGKKYVGKASGGNMILGRWKDYINNGHGGNVELKKLSFEYIKENFRYSILDIYKSTTDDQIILERESWWTKVLQTRTFGYNFSIQANQNL